MSKPKQDVKRKYPIMNLYGSANECKEAFNVACSALTGNGYKFSLRNLSIETDVSILYFRYFTDYSAAKELLLGGQYYKINFYVVLPEEVKNHFLSRIRVFNHE